MRNGTRFNPKPRINVDVKFLEKTCIFSVMGLTYFGMSIICLMLDFRVFVYAQLKHS